MPRGRQQLIYDSRVEITVGALAANTAISVASKLDGSQEQGAILDKCRAFCEHHSKTANEGPIVVGYAVGLSDAEIGEAFVSDPQRAEDPGASEQANRKIVPLWIIPRQSTQLDGPNHVPRLSPVKVPSFHKIEGDGVRWFAFNTQTGSALTTGTIILIVAQWLVRWMHD